MTDYDVDRVFRSLRARLALKRFPVSTYRLQFNGHLTFNDTGRIIPYLHELGISHLYASPYFKAHPGSPHGYDISNHNSLNPEIGSKKDYHRFVSRLRSKGMGHILDFVPNHMGIFDNPWWQDVLENGPSSPYSEFFDIDWHPAKPELREKVLLPILEDHYGKVLDDGGIRLIFDRGAFFIVCGEHRLPVDPKTMAIVFTPCLDHLDKDPGQDSPDSLEMRSIITACNNLPSRSERSEQKTAERQREKEIIKKRLRLLYEASEKIRVSLDETVQALNGSPGDSRSFDHLHELLENQTYRLSYWRVASDEINYRRFFDINHLVALRMEDVRVFNATHQLLAEFLREGLADGVRIDHIDGLFDPTQYLRRLQKLYIEELSWQEAREILKLTADEQQAWKEASLPRFTQGLHRNGLDPVFRSPLYIVVEKILAEKEPLPKDWPVDGTTGYEFASALNGIFVNRRNGRALRNIYQWFTRSNDSFGDIAYRSKNLIMQVSMSAEVNVLARQLDRASEQSRMYRDFTLNSLTDAIREVIACFPVYRTYIDAYGDIIAERDRAIVHAAVTEAKRRNPAISSSLFDFIRDALLLVYPPDMTNEGRKEQQLFVMRFQQLTGPVMAKGVEDTAFYIYNPLVSLNDVGGNPNRFGSTVDDFHRKNAERHDRFIHSLLCTSTHDAKRSEDVRARINALSEIPRDWKAALTRWNRLNRDKKVTLNGETIPDRNDEYLVYQTLLGTYPAQEMNGEEREEYLRRIQSYMLKATREAKVHTSWVSPDASYEKAVTDFVTGLLVPSESNSFLKDFFQINRVVTSCGIYNSLAQLVLKVFSPGVPDVYQGAELWDFSLVDPDNRRPVNFSFRARLLQSLKRQVEKQGLAVVVRELMARREDGAIKIFVTWKGLDYRRNNTDLFNAGAYIPLKAEGSKKGHVCAFEWRSANAQALVIVPRLVAKLTRNADIAPLSTDAWGDTLVILHRHRPGKFRNIFTGETLNSTPNQEGRGLWLKEVFNISPVAVLEAVRD